MTGRSIAGLRQCAATLRFADRLRKTNLLADHLYFMLNTPIRNVQPKIEPCHLRGRASLRATSRLACDCSSSGCLLLWIFGWIHISVRQVRIVLQKRLNLIGLG